MDNSHLRSYKNRGKDLEELRRRRNEVNLELRKNKRDEALLKKRNVDFGSDDDTDLETLTDAKLSIEYLNALVINAMNPNLDEQFAAVKAIRKLLSTDKNPPIDQIIAAGILPVLVNALSYEQMPLLQFEAAWALTNIASGTSEQTRKVVEAGSVPLFIKLLSSDNESVAEQSVWALGNIIGDGPDLRDMVLSQGLLEPLIHLFEKNTPVTFMRNLTWVIVNICRNKSPPPHLEIIKNLLPVLLFLLQHSNDSLILIDVIWTISYITDHGNEQIQLVIDSGVAGYIVPLLGHEDVKIQIPALRVVGNIATGNDDQTQAVLDLGAFNYMTSLLQHSKERIAREALWFVSNITAGRMDQIQMLIDKNIIPIVIEHLSKPSFTLQREAAWAISNMTMNGSSDQVKHLLDHSVLEPICNLLTVKDTQTLQILLEAITKIFAHFPEENQRIAEEIEKHGGLDIIEELQNHPNEEVYQYAYKIIDKYFESANDEVPDLVPQTNETGFNFGQQTKELKPDQKFNF